MPDDEAGQRETHNGNAVYADAEKVFDPVRAIEIVETEQAHDREHQDSITRAEVTAIHCRKELEDNGAGPPESHLFLFERSEPQSLVDLSMKHEKNRSKQNQKGNE